MRMTSAEPASFGPPEWLSVWAEQLMLGLGYPGLALLIVIEQLIPPIPSTLILPTAGFLVSRGVWSLPGVIVAATIGSLLSALLLYGLGRWTDQALLGRLADRYGRWAGLSAARIDRVLATFDRYGPALVFTGRFVGTVRSLISIPAGMRRMPLSIFLPLTALGASLWNALLATAGMLLGERWAELEPLVAQYDDVTLLVVAAAVIILLVARWHVRRS